MDGAPLETVSLECNFPPSELKVFAFAYYFLEGEIELLGGKYERDFRTVYGRAGRRFRRTNSL
jgi:hypothetical protein